MSTYGIFVNKKTNKRLVYYPVPKNGNTSAKFFFAKHIGIDNKYKFLGDSKPSYKTFDSDFNEKKNIVKFLPTKQKFNRIKADFKCCILRDPVKRFLSAFKNRILYHKDKSFGGLSIDLIIEQMSKGNFENRHFLPQTFFLGEDLSYYSFYSDIDNISFFEEKVNDFFGKKISFPKIQTRGKEFDVTLSVDQINKIIKIYSSDYLLMNQI